MIDPITIYFDRLDKLCPQRREDTSSLRQITIPVIARPLLEDMIVQFSGFIGNIAKIYIRGDHKFDYDDLWQEGAIGFVVAVWKYNPAAGLFVSYAKRRVKTSIWRAICNNGYIISLPVNNVHEAARDGNEEARQIKNDFSCLSLDRVELHSSYRYLATGDKITSNANEINLETLGYIMGNTDVVFRETRNDLGLSQDKLALILKCNGSSLSRIESGQHVAGDKLIETLILAAADRGLDILKRYEEGNNEH